MDSNTGAIDLGGAGRKAPILGPRERRIGLAFGILCLVFELAHLVRNLGAHPLATAFEDDFFYYVMIARNILHGHGSSFDQVTMTNGYQPLWMGVMLALEAVLGDQAGLLWAVLALSLALVGSGVLLLARYLALTAADEGWGEAWVAPGALFYGVAGLRIATNGMEVALLWPLLPALLLALRALVREPRARLYGWTGLVIALVGLARLDAALFVLPLCAWSAVLVLRRVGLATALRQGAAATLIGLSPLILYLLSNGLIFGDLVPLSGLAKRLLVTHGLFVSQGLLRAREALGGAVILGLIAPVGLGLVVALTRGGRRAVIAGVYLPIVAGGLIYYGTNLVTSDWILWSWYYFALALTSALSIGLAGPILAPGLSRAGKGLAYLLIASLLVMISLTRLDNSMLQAGGALRDFARTHPGRYAMGDRAGMVAWSMDQGLVQLEGLVSDRAMLEDIRRQVPLSASLRRQGVDYYIATDAVLREGCFESLEPAEPGPAAAKMRGRFCGPPVLTYSTWGVYLKRPVVTRVFALRKRPG